MSGIHQALLAGQAPVPYRTYVTQATAAGGTSTATFSGISIGAEDPSRLVVVCLMVTSGGLRTVSSLTIAGGSAVGVRNDASTEHVSIWRRPVATGTTADIAVTMDGTASSFGIAVYALYNLASGSPVSSATGRVTSAASNARTVAVSEGGLVVAAHLIGSSTAISWTGVTEDFESGVRSSASDQNLAANASYLVATTWSGSATSRLTVASWR